MNDYKEMYFLLFNKITDNIARLQELQQQAEEMYIIHEEATIGMVELPTNEETNWFKNKSNYLILR